MPNITEEKWIEMLEKKADGTYIAKYPKVKSKSGITFDEHLDNDTSAHGGVDADSILSKLLTIPGFDMSSFTKAVTGSYVGDGAYTRNITLGYKPKFIFVRDNKTYEADKPNAWICMENHGIAFEHGGPYVVGGTSSVRLIKPISNGIEVAHADGQYGYSSNEPGMTYYYVAIV